MKTFLTPVLKNLIPQCVIVFIAISFLLPAEALPHENDNNLVLTGNITNITDSTLTVTWLTINVDSNTVIKDSVGNFDTLSNFSTGEFVEVKAVLTSDGLFIATELKPEREEDHDNGLEVNANIEEIDSSSIMVSELQIYVDEYTRIKRGEYERIKFDDLNPGDSVEVHAELDSAGYFLANKIEVKTKRYCDQKLEIEGFITALSDSSLTVNGFEILVDESTMIYSHYNMIMFKDLNINDFVRVNAVYQRDSSLLAREIILKNEIEIVLTGIIDSVDTSSIVVNGMTVFVNDQTQIALENCQPISFNDLMTGMKVEIKALLQPDNTLLATRIEVEDQNEQHIRITAPIDTIISSSIIVGGITFDTDTNTVILGSDYTPISFDSLRTGMIVKVKGTFKSPGVYLATLIKIKDFWCRDTDIMGTLTTVSSGGITIGNNEYAFAPDAVLLDESGNAVSESHFTQGMQVNVRTTKTAQGIEQIVRMKVRNADEIDFDGTIDNISSSIMTIGNQTLELQGYTFITYLNGDPVSPADLKDGFSVSTQVISASNQMMKATYITVNRNPDIIKTTGSVVEKTNDYIVVSQPQFQINNSTVILNSEYHLAEYNSINVGDNVTIWSQKSASGNLTALQIQSQSNSVTNVNENNSETVTKYSLSQNYPNPFNPSTTIRFTLPEHSFVSLKVYNIIGQQVANLVNGNMETGTYNINFDASNLPSGVYLYRIRANNFTQVHKMLLVK